jgi:hypothetical protein
MSAFHPLRTLGLALGCKFFQLPLRHPAGVEDNDLAGADHGRQAVGDYDGGAVLRDADPREKWLVM